MTTTTTATETVKFEVGETYYDRSSCNWDCIFRVTVTKRTAKSVWIIDPMDQDKTPKRKAIKDFGDGVERFYPHGRYSMASVIRADRKAADLDKEAA